MKPRHLVTLLLLFCFACEKEKENNAFHAETEERFSIIQEEITTMPKTPIGFYWEPDIKVQLTWAPITTCLSTEVKFDYPYIIANGFKFHAYYWGRTENQMHGRNVVLVKIAFYKEK